MTKKSPHTSGPKVLGVSRSRSREAILSRQYESPVKDRSQIEEHGFLFALHMNIEPVNGLAGPRHTPRDQGRAPLRGHRTQHRIALVGRGLIVEINSRE